MSQTTLDMNTRNEIMQQQGGEDITDSDKINSVFSKYNTYFDDIYAVSNYDEVTMTTPPPKNSKSSLNEDANGEECEEEDKSKWCTPLTSQSYFGNGDEESDLMAYVGYMFDKTEIDIVDRNLSKSSVNVMQDTISLMQSVIRLPSTLFQ